MTSSTPKRQYKPGFRTKAYGTLGENQVAWVETHYGMIALTSTPWREDDELAEFSPGPNVFMHLPPGRNVMKLSTLTVKELDKLKEFFELAFELAYPVAAERDRVSDVEQANGNDAVIRGYRRAPRMVVRPWPLSKHHEGVLFGSAEVSGGDTDADSNSGGTGGSGPVVAAGEQEQGISSNDTSETDQS